MDEILYSDKHQFVTEHKPENNTEHQEERHSYEFPTI